VSRARYGSRLGAVLLLILAAGCSSLVAPHTEAYAPIGPDIPPRLYVTANAERWAVLAALEKTGFSIVSDFREAPLVLAVTLGASRGSAECGSIRNVVYELSHGGVRIAVIRGRGYTGRCSPNILHDMSAELARLFHQPS